MRKTWYNLSKEHLTSFNMGECVPVLCKEVLPGDVWRQESVALVRTLPLSKPLYQHVNAELISFYIRVRDIWEDFDDFITGGPDGTSEPDYPVVEIPEGGFAVGSLAHHLGCTPSEGDGQFVSALRFRAVNAIHNHWIRNQFLVAPLALSTASGVDTTTNLDLFMGMWEKDFFTTLMLEPQLGDDTVIPVLGEAPVRSTNSNIDFKAPAGASIEASRSDGTIGIIGGGTGAGVQFGDDTGLETDLAEASGIGVSQLRLANYFQRWKEKKSFEGAEYKDALNQLGIRIHDDQLGIPQRLGRSSTPLQFSEVLATAQSTGVEIGDMKGHGITGLKTRGIRHTFPEWGFVVTMMMVRPKSGYMQAMDPDWFYTNKYDYWQPGMEHVGAAEVYNKQLRLGHNSPNGILGWGPRYDGLRYSENSVAGELYSTENDFHQYRNIPVDAALNADLATCVPTDRIYPVDRRNADNLKVRLIHQINVKRFLSPNINNFLK